MKRYYIILQMIICLFTAKEIKAQPEFDDSVEDTPIDSFTSVLTIGAIILGVKNYKNFFSSDKFSKKSR